MQAWTFMKTSKCEEVYLADYPTPEDVVDRLVCSIDDVYNTKRLHSALRSMRPVRFQIANLRQAA